ncbi:putative YkwD family protein [Paenibacillus castaneae]|uniref:CAP domain-containing protein n=1 Tax=Paenibacillus castaneae TaxID=474957 RepID=UPI001FBA6D64|nr:CAP domain-containing protein [Paenibacillus castaneae]NIK75821.1 putative YkwD family protein [Paenibacillus castaneae]
MYKFIVLAGLLLLTACGANNNLTQKQVTPKQARIETKVHTHSAARSHTPTITQASSIATPELPGAGKSSLRAKQAPNAGSNWLDLLNPARTPIQNPVKTPMQNPVQSPTQKPVTQEPATKTPDQGSNTSQNNSQFEQQVLDLVNQERSKAGLKSLSMNGELSKMAMVKAQDMYDNNYFDHNSPTHGSPFDMMKEYGITYSSAGENIAKGQNSPTQVMNDWMNSPGHRANILKDSFTQIGIAYYNGEWVQEFIG